MGYVWLTLGLSALLIWFILIFLPFERIQPLMIQNWFQSGSSQIELIFAINSNNWAVVIALLSLHMFFLFIAATQPDLNRDFKFWIIEVVEVALTLIVFISANLLTVILAWTIFDIAILLYRIFVRENHKNNEIYYPYIFKLAGSFLLIYTNAKLIGSGQNTLLENLPVSASLTLFFAALLHSGILPYRPMKQGQKLVITIVDHFAFFLPFISSLFLVAYLPVPNLSIVIRAILGFLFSGIVYYFSSRWLSVKNMLGAIQNNLFLFIGFLGFLFTVNYRSSILHWFVILIICLNYLVLNYRQSKTLRIFSILLIMSMTGLPFSLIDYSTVELNTLPSYILILGLISFHVIWNIGFLRLLFKEKDAFEELESSYQMIYIAGLGLVILSLGIITFRSLGSLINELVNWWIGVVIVLSTMAIYFWQTRRKPETEEKVKSPERFRVTEILTFSWFFSIADNFIQFMRMIVSTFTQILEGEGGVLWSIVLLALLFTLLKIG